MSPARRKPIEEEAGFVDFGDASRMADPAVNAILNQGERRQSESRLPKKEQEKKRKEREKMRQRKPGHTTYDIPVALRKRIADLAERQGVPASQLAALALLRLVQDLDGGLLDLGSYKVPSRSPRFDYNLLLPLELLDGSAARPRRRGRGEGG